MQTMKKSTQLDRIRAIRKPILPGPRVIVDKKTKVKYERLKWVATFED